MIGTFLPRNGKLLILINGAYGKRAARICDYAGRTHADIEWAEDQAVDPRRVEAVLKGDPAITHVFVVHCETTSGVLNPIAEIAKVVAAVGRRLLIDSMSAFGALPLDAREIPFDAVAASSNKCIEGVPGVGFVICRRDALEAAKGNAHSLSLDLHDQCTAMEKTAQWRFTPPIQVIVAFEQALREHGRADRGPRRQGIAQGAGADAGPEEARPAHHPHQPQHAYETVQQALQSARLHAHKDDLILVCGSFFIVAEAM